MDLNSEVMELKLFSLNNGVSEAKCHVRSCSFNEIQTDSSLFEITVSPHVTLLQVILYFLKHITQV